MPDAAVTSEISPSTAHAPAARPAPAPPGPPSRRPPSPPCPVVGGGERRQVGRRRRPMPDHDGLPQGEHAPRTRRTARAIDRRPDGRRAPVRPDRPDRRAAPGRRPDPSALPRPPSPPSSPPPPSPPPAPRPLRSARGQSRPAPAPAPTTRTRTGRPPGSTLTRAPSGAACRAAATTVRRVLPGRRPGTGPRRVHAPGSARRRRTAPTPAPSRTAPARAGTTAASAVTNPPVAPPQHPATPPRPRAHVRPLSARPTISCSSAWTCPLVTTL